MGTTSIVLTPVEAALCVALLTTLGWIFNRVILRRISDAEKKLDTLSSKYASKEDFKAFREEALAAFKRIEDRVDDRISDLNSVERETAVKLAGVQALVNNHLEMEKR